MIQEHAAGRSTGQSFLTRLLTPLIRHVGSRLLRWEPEGSITVELPTRQRIRFGRASTDGEPVLSLRNYGVLAKSVRRGPNGFAEAYMDEDIDCTDLVALFRFFVRNRAKLESSGRGFFKVRLPDRVLHLARRNTRRGSRRNISAHYDLGNEFYRLWLDPELNYSSGLYARGARTLEQAQQDKLDLILDHLDLHGGERILEIGCGWGALARRAARLHDAEVTGVTLSREQLAHARDAAAREGLSARADFRLQDYRDVAGHYDHIVSIEMIEAVGQDNWPRYFSVLHDRLRPGGTAVIQSITMGECRFEAYRKRTDFIQRYIFPGGMLPTASIIEGEARRAGLELVDQTRFGPCYARTLAEWRKRFEVAWPQIARLGFDEHFRRRWRYYLAYCEAGFLEGVVDVGTYVLRRP